MKTLRETAERYIAAWNEPDPARRRSLVAEGWAEDGRYVDPMMAAEGRDGIAAMIEGVRARFPEHLFRLKGEPDGHGPHLRFSWTLAPTDGEPFVGGTDIAHVDAEGRLTDVVGFLDGSVADA